MSAPRFADEHITETAILAGSYLVSDWTADNGFAWVVASGYIVRPYSIKVKGLNGITKTQGDTTVDDWVFDVVSGSMLNYLKTTVFSSVLSIEATIYTFNQTELDWQAYQCIATLNDEDMIPFGNIGFKGVKIEFSDCLLNVE